MSAVYLILLAGCSAGLVHVLAGPDHLTALAPLAADVPRNAWRSGLTWGLGHSFGVLGIAALMLLVRGALPVDALSYVSERVVGVMLVFIGLWGLRRMVLHSRNARAHVHVHEHEGVRHAHLHLHSGSADHDQPQAHTHRHLSLAMGLVHGLAGSAHILGVLPALAFVTVAHSAVYLAGFAAGGILAMTGFAWAVGALTAGWSNRDIRAGHWMLAASSSASIVFGVIWIVA